MIRSLLKLNKSMKQLILYMVVVCSYHLAHTQQLDWIDTYGGHGNDDAEAMTLDNRGNIFVVGSFSDTIDFDGSTADAILDSEGTDSYVLKLDSDGNFLWVRHLDGLLDAQNLVWDVTIDVEGSVIVIGEFTVQSNFDPGGSDVTVDAQSRDGYIVKYDNEGNFIWVKAFGSTEFKFQSVEVDKNNDYYFAGSFRGSVDFDPGSGEERLNTRGVQDIFLLKLNSDGELIWVNQLGTPEGEEANYILADGDHLYWTGYFKNTLDFDLGDGESLLTSRDESSDIFIQKLTLDGEHIWVRRYGGDSSDEGNFIATDSKGNVVLGGDYLGEVHFSDDNSLVFPNVFDAGFLLKLDSEGKLIWVRIVKEPEGVVLDESDHIYTIGQFRRSFDFDPSEEELLVDPEVGWDIFVQEFDAEGNHLSLELFPTTTGGGTNEFQDFALDGQGNLITSGVFRSTVDFDSSDDVLELTPTPRSSDAFVMKLKLENSTALNELDISQQINVFPNPAQRTLEISISDLDQGKLIATLYNLQGFELSQATTHGNNLRMSLDEGLPDGMYLIKIESEQGIGTIPVLLAK